jgi:hypothetical protein
MLTSSFDFIPLILMSVATVLIVVALIIGWPDFVRERATDAEETRILDEQARAIQAEFDRGR